LPPAASAPGATAAVSSASGRLAFDGGSAALSDGSRQELDRLAGTMGGNEAQRLQVVAYAAGQANNTTAARRLSLSRALAVRSYLIDKGIRSTRIDVRAMGAPEGANSGPADRVDLVLVSQ
jgi:outer membrane protein OmpA-like peptidoglycan-associated protein